MDLHLQVCPQDGFYPNLEAVMTSCQIKTLELFLTYCQIVAVQLD